MLILGSLSSNKLKNPFLKFKDLMVVGFHDSCELKLMFMLLLSFDSCLFARFSFFDPSMWYSCDVHDKPSSSCLLSDVFMSIKWRKLLNKQIMLLICLIKCLCEGIRAIIACWLEIPNCVQDHACQVFSEKP